MIFLHYPYKVSVFLTVTILLLYQNRIFPKQQQDIQKEVSATRTMKNKKSKRIAQKKLSIVSLTKDHFNNILNNSKPALVIIHARWCDFSQKHLDTIETIISDWHHYSDFYSMELKEFHPEDPAYAFLLKEYNFHLNATPTTLLIHKGTIISYEDKVLTPNALHIFMKKHFTHKK